MNLTRSGPPMILVLLLAGVAAAAGCRAAGLGTRSAPAPPEQVAAAGEVGDRRVARAEELLTGRFAGVEVFRLANGGIAVRIRGTSTLMGGGEPLYVLDGMPLTPGPGGALHGINPADIQRIEVLKDIGSTSFYGVRGANGVVLITTRRPPREEPDSAR